MKLRAMLALGLAVLALGALPATGSAEGVNYNPEGPNYQPEHPNHPPKGPKSAPKGNAHGYYCRGQSKKHVKGEKGTPFSQCVKGVNQMRREENATVTASSVA